MLQDGRILIVDDDEDILLSLELLLSQHFKVVQTANDPRRIPDLLEKNIYDVFLLDINFTKGETSGAEGLRWLKTVKAIQPNSQVIMITAYAEVNTAVAALKAGAMDFIEKPWRNEKLLATVKSAYQLSQTQHEISKLKDKHEILLESDDIQAGEIIGNSPAIQQVFRLIEKVAKTDANVLILGENGTGKELAAREIHRLSPRSSSTFVKVDLGAVAETLFESELFGHVKGAFTDAKKDRMGRFELASGGTLFLDEIGNLNLPLQAKLLSALQNRIITRVGSNKNISVDIRLICATNRSITDMIAEKAFRQDLLYRINTVEIKLPPLRERVSDIPVLVKHFLNLYKKKYQKRNLKIDQASVRRLQEYPWYGNIRELRHSIERAVILSEGNQLSIADFIHQGSDADNLDEKELNTYNLEELERWAIRKAMTKHGGNISKAAAELGLTRATLYRRLEKYEL